MKRYLLTVLSVVVMNAQEVNIINKEPTLETLNAIKLSSETKQGDEGLDVFDIKRAKPPLMMNVDKTNLAILYLIRNDTKAMHEIVLKEDFDLLEASKIVLGDKEFTGKSYSFFSALVEKKRFDILDAIFAKLSPEQLQSPYLRFVLYASINKDMQAYRYLLDKGLAPSYANEYGDTTLTALCQYATLEDVKYAIQKGATIDTLNPLFLQNALYGKKYDIVRYLLEHYAFDINMKPCDNRHFPSFLFYLIALDSSKEDEKALFFELLSRFNDESINTHGKEFMQRLQKSNTTLYQIAKTDKHLKQMEKCNETRDDSNECRDR